MPIAADTLVHVAGLTKSYGRITAIRDVSFTIRSTEILGLIGPNGAGKTTLLECVAGVQPFDSGNVRFPDRNTTCSAEVFYIPDAIAPWPEQSVRWAIEFSLGFFDGPAVLRDEVISDLRLEPLLPVRIGALSKGQRKRVLLAIGLLSPRPILLIDEPFEGLDLRQSREVAAVLRKHVERGRTIFVSIHQISDSARICDRFVLLSGGDVIAEGTMDNLRTLAAKHSSTPVNDFEEIFLALT